MQHESILGQYPQSEYTASLTRDNAEGDPAAEIPPNLPDAANYCDQKKIIKGAMRCFIQTGVILYTQ